VAQLFNPVGNASILRPQKLIVSHDSATITASFFVLTTLIDITGGAGWGAIVNPKDPQQKYGSGKTTIVSSAVLPTGVGIASFYVPPFTLPYELDLRNVTLPPGMGLSVYRLEVQTDMEATWIWFEESLSR